MLVLALASTALAASPAAATTDNAGYVGIEAGLWFPNDLELDFDFDDGYNYDLDVEYNLGFDGDIIGGYDFGAFRLEAEFGYKSASHDKAELTVGDFQEDADIDGDTSVFSLMGNALWNPSFGDRWDAYLGGGLGWAWMKFDGGDGFGSEKDNGFAWQIIAGVGYQVSDNIELA